jgi:hypothetical protein
MVTYKEGSDLNPGHWTWIWWWTTWHWDRIVSEYCRFRYHLPLEKCSTFMYPQGLVQQLQASIQIGIFSLLTKHKQGRQSRYNIWWLLRIMFATRRLPWQSDTISLQHIILQRFKFFGNNKIHTGLHVNARYFCPIVTEFGFFLDRFP